MSSCLSGFELTVIRVWFICPCARLPGNWHLGTELWPGSQETRMLVPAPGLFNLVALNNWPTFLGLSVLNCSMKKEDWIIFKVLFSSNIIINEIVGYCNLIDLGSIHIHQSLVPLTPFNWMVWGEDWFLYLGVLRRESHVWGDLYWAALESPCSNLYSFLECLSSPLFL